MSKILDFGGIDCPQDTCAKLATPLLTGALTGTIALFTLKEDQKKKINHYFLAVGVLCAYLATAGFYIFSCKPERSFVFCNTAITVSHVLILALVAISFGAIAVFSWPLYELFKCIRGCLSVERAHGAADSFSALCFLFKYCLWDVPTGKIKKLGGIYFSKKNELKENRKKK